MKNFKSFLGILLCFCLPVLLTTLVACGDKDSDDEPDDPSTENVWKPFSLSGRLVTSGDDYRLDERITIEFVTESECTWAFDWTYRRENYIEPNKPYIEQSSTSGNGTYRQSDSKIEIYEDSGYKKWTLTKSGSSWELALSKDRVMTFN